MPRRDPAATRELLAQVTSGRPQSVEQLMPLVYEELRAVARSYYGAAHAHRTLQPTALVHEAFVKLVGMETAPKDREHFLALSSKAMREILVDQARRRSADKRGGGRQRVTLGGDLDQLVATNEVDVDLVALDEALHRLAEVDPQQARIVELRFFGGMTGQEIANVVGVSRNTVVRDLTMARAWLLQALGEGGPDRGRADA